MERSFTYIYDASGMTDGSSLNGISLPIQQQGSRFSLRRVVGLDKVATAINIQRPGSNLNLASAPVRMGAQCLISPPLEWEGNHTLTFGLSNVQRSVTLCGGFPIYNSVLGFQGAVVDNTPSPSEPPDTAVAFQFTFPLVLDWYRYVDLLSGAKNPPRTFRLPMDYGHFTLNRIAISKVGVPLNSEDFFIRLYDSQDGALSSGMVPQSFYNSASSLRSGFWPPIHYPATRALKFDVESRICNLDGVMPKTYQISFGGLLWSKR